MALPPGAADALLAQVKAELIADLEKARVDTEDKLGKVVTEVHSKVREVDQGLGRLSEAGNTVME